MIVKIDDAIDDPKRILPSVLKGYSLLKTPDNDKVRYCCGYCIVYPLISPNNPNKGKSDCIPDKCIRLWHSDFDKDHVKKLIGELGKIKHNEGLTFLMEYEYYEKGLELENKEIIPAVVMDWVNGKALNTFINENYSNTMAIKHVTKEFYNMIVLMRKYKLAHGDLSGDNIIVKPDGNLMLIDYDSFYIEGMKTVVKTTKGTQGFIHREKRKELSLNMDNFSQQVIYLSLLAVAKNPSLGKKEKKFIEDHKMFFYGCNFVNDKEFTGSEGYKAIAKIKDKEIEGRLAELRRAVGGNLSDVRSIVEYQTSPYEEEVYNPEQNHYQEEVYKPRTIKEEPVYAPGPSSNGEERQDPIPPKPPITPRPPIQPVGPTPSYNQESTSETPWYKKWYTWLGAAAAAVILLFAIIPSSSNSSADGIQQEQALTTAINNIDGNYTLREKNGSTLVNGIRTAAIKKISSDKANILVMSEYGQDLYSFSFTSDGKVQSEELGDGEITYKEKLDKTTIRFKQGERVCEFTK
jgi:hypothetical protein